MPKITIPLAQIDDAEALLDIALTAFSHSVEKYGRLPQGMDQLDKHRSAIQTGLYHKVEHDGELVGGILFSVQSEHQMCVEVFFIHPDAQGKQIGSAVLDQIESMYPHVTTWTLVTPDREYRNHHFYEKQGYRKVGEFTPDPNRNFTLFQYEKTSGS